MIWGKSNDTVTLSILPLNNKLTQFLAVNIQKRFHKPVYGYNIYNSIIFSGILRTLLNISLVLSFFGISGPGYLKGKMYFNATSN